MGMGGETPGTLALLLLLALRAAEGCESSINTVSLCREKRAIQPLSGVVVSKNPSGLGFWMAGHTTEWLNQMALLLYNTFLQ